MPIANTCSIGYPHDSRADNAAYRHDRRADNAAYRHDRRADSLSRKIYRGVSIPPYLHSRTAFERSVKLRESSVVSLFKKHIDKLENVQRRSTKSIHGLSNLSHVCEVRLRTRHVNIPTLTYRRSRGDMIEHIKFSLEI